MQALVSFLAQHLAHHSFFQYHFDNSLSALLTTLAVLLLLVILAYKLVFQIGVWCDWWELPGKEYFLDKPVHCAHIYISGHILQNGTRSQIKPLKFHLEFSPEEYNEKDPELGSTLGFTRKKLYFLFKDSQWFKRYAHEKKQLLFKIGDVRILGKKGDLLTDDDKPLCLLGIETGDTVNVEFSV